MSDGMRRGRAEIASDIKKAVDLRTLGHAGVYTSVVVGLFPFGAVHPLPKLFMGIIVGLTLMIALSQPIKRAAVQKLCKHAWWVLVLLVSYILLQSLTFEGNPLAHPFWESAGELASFSHGAISVEPSLSRFGLFSLVPPFLLFIAILHSFQGDEKAWRLIYFLSAVGAIFMIYGIAQKLFFPHYVFVRELESANTRFTSTLINRNHAATVVGLTSLIVMASIIRKAKGIPLWKFPTTVFLPSRLPPERRWILVLLSVTLLFCFIALFMTQSRGGFGATLVAWGILLPPLLSRVFTQAQREKSGFRVPGSSKVRQILYSIFFICVIGGFVSIYAEGTIFRIADSDGANPRFCNFPAMWTAYLDNWLFGSGFATFELMFPIYRSAACGYSEIWTQAHNFWLEGLMGLGVLFVPLAVFALWRLIAVYLVGIRTRRSQRFVAYVGISIITLIFLHSIVDFSLQIPGVALFTSAITAALCSLALERSH